MVRNNGSGIRLIATKNHVAPGLATEDEPGPFKGGARLKSGQIGGELGHGQSLPQLIPAQAASISTNSFPASVGTGSPASRQSST
jgi:hypothetical protein